MAATFHERLCELNDPFNENELKKCVQDIDQEFMNNNIEIKQHGSTACMLCLKPKSNGKLKAIVANVGDSRCLLIAPDGMVKFTTEDHKPDQVDEAARIRAAGGHVSYGRVD